jgi:hypothetical protein
MLQQLQNSAFSQWVVGSESILAYPTILTLHTVGLALVVGTAVVIDLRTLGVGTAIPLATLRSAFRIFWLGFVINLVSGLILFASEATTKGTQPVFFIKLALVAAGLIVTAALRRGTFSGEHAAAEPTPRARTLAGTSLLLWACAIVAGRLMAYL